MRELVLYIARALVDHPEQLRMTERMSRRGRVLELSCHPSDIGKLIGKNGRTIHAVRSVMSAAAERGRDRTILVIVD